MSEKIAWLTTADIEAALATGLDESSITPDGLVRAAVLIPFYRSEEGWQILYTRRTEHLETHKGQVAFPGGSADRTDHSLEDTALRETFEEIGIPPRAVTVLGHMNEMPTNTNFLITPVVGVIDWPVPLKIEEAEVSRVFSVPLAWLAEPQNYETRPVMRKNGILENVVFFKPFDGETIWGVTGRITLNLLNLLTKRAA